MNANSEVYNLDIYQEQHDSNIGHLLQNTGLLFNNKFCHHSYMHKFSLTCFFLQKFNQKKR